MKFLTPLEVTKLAPAARYLDKEELDGGLVDTLDFLVNLASLESMRPVLAVQGTPHKDAGSEASRGKHLVGAARSNGFGIFLLNAHTVRRRAWIASGFVRQRDDRTLCLPGVCLPLERWRGVEQALTELGRHKPALLKVQHDLASNVTTETDINWIVAQVRETAYLPGRKAPARRALLVPAGQTFFDTAFDLVATMQQPGLQAEGDSRKLKPLSGPDAVMQACNAVWNAVVRRLDRQGHLSIPAALPIFRKT